MSSHKGNGSTSSKGQDIDPNKVFNRDIRNEYLRKQYLKRTTGDSVEKTIHVKSIFNLTPKPKDGRIKRTIKWAVNPFGKPFLVMQMSVTAMIAYYLLFSLDFGDKYEEDTVLKPIRNWHRRKKEQLFSLSDREREMVRLKEKKDRELRNIINANQGAEVVEQKQE